jgi:energy-coupling factor transporter ATP-binding protein EcfA2
VRIKSLELNGFKSFVDKTRLEFREGITGVVGPNGCGKSNVVDAMRWVMGEQSPRRLRGKGMDDVIFAGSEGRSPIGLAEVVLSFDNSDGTGPPAFSAYSEIQVSRRLYRTGESEYLLNRTPCRLRDVHDFFRDSGIGTKGYTIVEQGRIAEIVSAKPEDRRGLIEEAAGIGKYKARRREAESKIKSTQQNLLRVTDVLGEIRRQINSIERQARKAARYKRLRETTRVVELSLAADDRRELGEGIEEARQRHRGLLEEVTGFEAQLAGRELEVEERRIELAECERVLSRGSEALLALRGQIKEAEGRIEYGHWRCAARSRRPRDASSTGSASARPWRRPSRPAGRSWRGCASSWRRRRLRPVRRATSCAPWRARWPPRSRASPARRGTPPRPSRGCRSSSGSATSPTRRWSTCSPSWRATRTGSPTSRTAARRSTRGCGAPTRAWSLDRTRRPAPTRSSAPWRRGCATCWRSATG